MKKNSPGAPESESVDIAKKLIPLFDEPVEIRAAHYQDEWYLSVNDVIKFLTGSTDPGQYWKRMRARAKTEEWEATAQEVIELPLPDSSGRLQNTNCANRKTLLRLVQSIFLT